MKVAHVPLPDVGGPVIRLLPWMMLLSIFSTEIIATQSQLGFVIKGERIRSPAANSQNADALPIQFYIPPQCQTDRVKTELVKVSNILVDSLGTPRASLACIDPMRGQVYFTY